jgi:hypothetical protein
MQFERGRVLADRQRNDPELPADHKRRRLDAPGCAHSDQQERFCCCHFGCYYDRNRAEHRNNNSNDNHNDWKHDHLPDNHRHHRNDDHRSELDNDDNDCSYDNHLPDNHLPVHNNDFPDHNHNDDADHDHNDQRAHWKPLLVKRLRERHPQRP